MGLPKHDFDGLSLKFMEIYIGNIDIGLEVILVYWEQLHQVSRRVQYPWYKRFHIFNVFIKKSFDSFYFSPKLFNQKQSLITS